MDVEKVLTDARHTVQKSRELRAQLPLMFKEWLEEGAYKNGVPLKQLPWEAKKKLHDELMDVAGCGFDDLGGGALALSAYTNLNVLHQTLLRTAEFSLCGLYERMADDEETAMQRCPQQPSITLITDDIHEVSFCAKHGNEALAARPDIYRAVE